MRFLLKTPKIVVTADFSSETKDTKTKPSMKLRAKLLIDHLTTVGDLEFDVTTKWTTWFYLNRTIQIKKPQRVILIKSTSFRLFVSGSVPKQVSHQCIRTGYKQNFNYATVTMVTELLTRSRNKCEVFLECLARAIYVTAEQTENNLCIVFGSRASYSWNNKGYTLNAAENRSINASRNGWFA